MSPVSEHIRDSARRVADALAPFEDDLSAALPMVVSQFDDDALQELLRDAAALRSEVDAVIAAGAGAIAKRSERELGYAGLAARKGHRTPAAMVQSITGGSRIEASRQVRLGEAMGETDAALRLVGAIDHGDPGSKEASAPGIPPGNGPAFEMPWYAPITQALDSHRVSSEGASALMRGLGEPDERCGVDVLRAAAEELLSDVAGVNVDELAKRARWFRDRLDPEGVNIRAEERYRARGWRFGRNGAGARTAWIQFDDESAAWIDGIVNAGTRPRRGGPRFVDKAEAEAAQKLVDDPRSNDQVVFDLLMDVLRAGAIADPSTGFGSKQPGIRVIISQDELQKRDEDGHLTGVGFFEETGERAAPGMIERMLCETGTRPITLDSAGNPLDVGREQRLFTARQRVGLAIRDGGCMAPGCDRPPSYTEAHHINEWKADHGKTDIADGILLCRYDHMRIHDQHWKIRREDSVYWMIPPPGIDPEQTPIRMRSKAAWQQRRAG